MNSKSEPKQNNVISAEYC